MGLSIYDKTGISIFRGDIVLGENSLSLEETIGTDQNWSGSTCSGVLGGTITKGKTVYLANGDDRWELTDANAVTTCGDVMTGICLVGGVDGGATTILLNGFYRDDTAFEFTSGGDALYFSETGGALTATAPGSGTVVRVAGYAHDDKETIYFNPSNDWVEVA